MERALLLQLPFRSPFVANELFGWLKELLVANAYDCQVYYANIATYASLGASDYRTLSDASEMGVFTRPALNDLQCLLGELKARFDWRRYRIVWLAVPRQQHVLAIGLAQHIRQQNSEAFVACSGLDPSSERFGSACFDACTTSVSIPELSEILGPRCPIQQTRSPLWRRDDDRGSGPAVTSPSEYIDDSHISCLRDHRLDESRIALPLVVSDMNGIAAAKMLLGISQRSQIANFAICLMDLGDACSTAFLSEISRFRQDSFYGLALSASFSVVSPIPLSLVNLCKRAGLRDATLLPPIHWSRDHRSMDLNLHQFATVKRMHAAGVELRWGLFAGDINAVSDAHGLVAWIKTMRHLPPPVCLWTKLGEPTSPDYQESIALIIDAITEWRRAYAPGTLTYASGPGFLKIFDRTGPPGNWRFIQLTTAQADVFRYCDEYRSLSDVSAHMSGISTAKVQALLQTFVQSGIVSCISGRYAALPTRRKMTEHWASGGFDS
jgi:hypothetical protein